MVARHFCTYAMLLVSITKGTIRGRGEKKKKKGEEKYFCAELNGNSKKRNTHLDMETCTIDSGC